MKRFAVALLSVASLGLAHADVFTASFSLPLSNTELQNYTGTLAAFDGSLGLLTGVNLTLFGAIQGSITLTLGASTVDAMVLARMNSDFSFASTHAGLDALLSASAPAMTLTYNSGSHLLNPNGSFTTASLGDANSRAYNLDSLLSSFNLPLSISCNTLTSLTIFGGGGYAGGSQITQASCGAQIDYIYTPTPVPEPGTLPMLGMGLLSLAYLVRKRMV